MMYKSVQEEWPYTNDEVWLRWTTDGVTFHEEIVHEDKIGSIDCLGVPEWRPLDAPEWMNEKQKAHFDCTKGSWEKKVGALANE